MQSDTRGNAHALTSPNIPQATTPPFNVLTAQYIQVRAKSPVFQYLVPGGDALATADTARRSIVDSAKCLACH